MGVIQRLQRDQWRILRAIRLKALVESPEAFGSTFEFESRFTENDWIERIERKGCATFVALLGSCEPIGLISGGPYDGNAGLYSMWTDPRYRRNGIASELIDAVIDWARNLQHAELILDVGDSNVAAIQLYESKGFHRTGVTGMLPAPRNHITEHQRSLKLKTDPFPDRVDVARQNGTPHVTIFDRHIAQT